MNFASASSLLLTALAVVVHSQQDMNGSRRRPNFIVMQPDDMEFFNEWGAPAHFPNGGDGFSYTGFTLPNIDRLRNQGLRMTQAHVASPVCAPSRYSTMTGRYASRAATSRDMGRGTTSMPHDVSIPTSRLEDVDTVSDGNDCSQNNVAQVLKAGGGYRTGVVGKWHLTGTSRNDFNYNEYIEHVKFCGFDHADAIFAGGFSQQGFADGTWSHNIEWITDQAVKFIKEESDNPFFLYLNPTAPHGQANVLEALTDFTCRHTPNGELESDIMIPGMTAEFNSCADYRQTIIDRAANSPANMMQNTLGSIWVDDSVGAIFKALEDTNQLDNTFFLFQIDHGQEGKGSLFQPGARIAQFIHYPDAFGTNGMTWDGLVSNIDISATILDFAGVEPTYQMDGVSWKEAVIDPAVLLFWRDERCVVSEVNNDRVLRCGCDKYMPLRNGLPNRVRNMGVADDPEMLFDLCDDGMTTEVGAPGFSPEATNVAEGNEAKLVELRTILETHLERTRADVEQDFSPLQVYPEPVVVDDTTNENPAPAPMMTSGGSLMATPAPMMMPGGSTMADAPLPTQSPTPAPMMEENVMTNVFAGTPAPTMDDETSDALWGAGTITVAPTSDTFVTSAAAPRRLGIRMTMGMVGMVATLALRL